MNFFIENFTLYGLFYPFICEIRNEISEAIQLDHM